MGVAVIEQTKWVATQAQRSAGALLNLDGVTLDGQTPQEGITLGHERIPSGKKWTVKTLAFGASKPDIGSYPGTSLGPIAMSAGTCDLQINGTTHTEWRVFTSNISIYVMATGEDTTSWHYNPNRLPSIGEGVTVPSGQAIAIRTTPVNAWQIVWRVFFWGLENGAFVTKGGLKYTYTTTSNQTLITYTPSNTFTLLGYHAEAFSIAHSIGEGRIFIDERCVFETGPFSHPGEYGSTQEDMGGMSLGYGHGGLFIPVGEISFYEGTTFEGMAYPFEADASIWTFNVFADQTDLGGGGGGTYPTANNVRTAVTYGPTGADYTGTLTLPTASQVKTGVSYGGGGTEFTGNVTLPATTNVRNAVSYGASGTEFTGTVQLPAVGSVLSTVSYGAGGTEFTGTYQVVAVSNVRNGVTFGAGGAQTGTVVLPAIADVKLSVNYGAGGTEYTGTYNPGGGTYPAVGNVLSGIQYGPSGTDYTGTYVTVAVGNVRLGTTFGASSALTGTLSLPAVGNVRTAIGYGSGGTEFTGTLTLPSINDVRLSTSFGAGGTEFTGNLNLPPVGQVISGWGYGSDTGVWEFTGTYVEPFVSNVRSGTTYGPSGSYSGNLTLPTQSQVKSGVGFGYGGGIEFTGNVTLPAQGDVRIATSYGANGTEFTGTLNPTGGSATIYTGVSFPGVSQKRAADS